MPISHSKTTCGVVISRRNINPGSLMWIEETSIVDAVRMLVQKYPRLSGTRIKEITHLKNVFVIGVPRTSLCIACTDPNISGHATAAFLPTPVCLSGSHEIVGWAFKHLG